MANLGTPDLTFGMPITNLKYNPSIAYVNLNATNTWFAQKFVTEEAKTLNTVAVNFTNQGALLYGDVEVHVFSAATDLTNTPVSSLGSSTTTASGNYNAYGINQFVGFNIALSARTAYWIVCKNLNAAPTTIYPRIGYFTLVGDQSWAGGGYNQPERRSTSTNAGATWGAPATCSALHLLGFSDGTYGGWILQGTGSNGFGTAYGTGKVGLKFKTPNWCKFRVRSVSVCMAKYGSPAAGCEMVMTEGLNNFTTVATSSNAVLAAQVSTTLNVERFFFDDVILKPNTWYNFCLHQVGDAGSNGNQYTLGGMFYFYSCIGAGLGTEPMNGTWGYCYSQGAPYGDPTVVPMAKIALDTVEPVEPMGSSVTITHC